MEQTIQAGTNVRVIVNVVDSSGAHVSATINTSTTRLQKGNTSDTTWNSATPTVDTIATGVYRINFSSLSPAVSVEDNDDLLRIAVNGDIAGTAWTEYHLPLRCEVNNASLGNLERSAGQIIEGTVSNSVISPTATAFNATTFSQSADHFNGRIIIFTSGNLSGQAREITDYDLNYGQGTFTVDALTQAPQNNDTFVIV